MRNLVTAFALVVTLALIPCVISGGDIQTDGKFVSTDVANPPMAVSSTALVSNLNADLVDGYDASHFVKVNQTATAFSTAQQIYVSGSDGKLPDYVVDDGSIEDVTRQIFFGCNQLDPGYSFYGPSMSFLGFAPALVFAKNPENKESITLSTLVPNDWDGTSGFEIRVFWAANVTSKNVYWWVEGTARTDDEELSVGPTYSSFLVGYGSSTSDGLVRSGPVTFDGGNFERGDLFSFQVKRDGEMPHDTLDADAYLVGVEISYVAVR